MKSNKIQSKLSGMTLRQKGILGALILIILIIFWYIYGMFRETHIPREVHTRAPMTAMNAGNPLQPAMPQPAQLAKLHPALTQRETELAQAQQETESKYITTANELQLLKLTQQIAETNQAIVAAKLATVTSEKKILDLLKPPTPAPTPATYARGLVNPVPVTPPPPPPVVQPVVQPPVEVNYSVISVSELQGEWSAVMGYQGSLFHVAIGDLLPPDESRVVSIDRSGVILEKNGVKKKISLISII